MALPACGLEASLGPKREVSHHLFYVVSGWVLLCLPLSRKSTDPSALDHLFTAMSAV